MTMQENTTPSASKTEPATATGKPAEAPSISSAAMPEKPPKKLPVPPPKGSMVEQGKKIRAKAKRAQAKPKTEAPSPKSTLTEPTKPANDDGLDIPDSLKVENRKPLTPEQKAKLDKERREQIEANLAKAKSAQDAIKRVTLVTPKKNGDAKLIADAVKNGKVHKVPAGKTYEQLMEDERERRHNSPSSRITRSPIPNSARQIALEDFSQRKRKPKPAPLPIAASGKSKTDIAREMLSRKDGATRKEIAEATNWPTINLKPIAERAGKKLIIDKNGYCRMT